MHPGKELLANVFASIMKGAPSEAMSSKPTKDLAEVFFLAGVATMMTGILPVMERGDPLAAQKFMQLIADGAKERVGEMKGEYAGMMMDQPFGGFKL